MKEQKRDIDKLLEATLYLEEECCVLFNEIDIDRLLERTRDW